MVGGDFSQTVLYDVDIEASKTDRLTDRQTDREGDQ